MVTGANGGIGSCFVDALLAAGAARVFACARDVASLAVARARHGDRLVPVPLDLTQPDSIDEAIRACTDVDLLISNAGRGGGGSPLGISDDDVRELFEVHVFGPRRLVVGLLPGLVDRRGGVILVQSTAALALSRGGPMYSASKAAATMMGMGLRESLRDTGVRVCNVHPGFTDTGMIAYYDIAKASPADVAAAALEGWANDEAHVYPDLYSQMVHEQVTTQADFVLNDPTRAGTELIERYRATTRDG